MILNKSEPEKSIPELFADLIDLVQAHEELQNKIHKNHMDNLWWSRNKFEDLADYQDYDKRHKKHYDKIDALNRPLEEECRVIISKGYTITHKLIKAGMPTGVWFHSGQYAVGIRDGALGLENLFKFYVKVLPWADSLPNINSLKN